MVPEIITTTYKRIGIFGLLVFVAVCAYIIYFTTASFLRHENFYSGQFDLGNMDQAVWNTKEGRIFMTNNQSGLSPQSRLGSHADVILVLLAPLYFFWEDPRMLLLVQSIVLGAGGVFVYLLAKEVTKSKFIGLAFNVSFLLNPVIGYSNLYDFHAVTFATTFLLAMFYFLATKKYKLAIVFAVLAGLTKEQVWVVTGLIGLYMALFLQQKRQGFILAGFSFFMFYVLLWHIIPSFRGGKEHFALEFFAAFGDSPSRVVATVITNPGFVFELLLDKERTDFLKQLLYPLGYLPLAFPFFLIFALPELLINLLSSAPTTRQIYYQYTAVITPFLFISAIYAVKYIRGIFPKTSTVPFALVILYFAITAARSYGPTLLSEKPNDAMFKKPYANKEIVQRELAKIPQSASVSSTNNLGAHLSHRQRLNVIPEGLYETNYIVFLLNDHFAQPSPDAQQQMVATLLTDPNYELLFDKDDFFIFKKKNSLQ